MRNVRQAMQSFSTSIHTCRMTPDCKARSQIVEDTSQSASRECNSVWTKRVPSHKSDTKDSNLQSAFQGFVLHFLEQPPFSVMPVLIMMSLWSTSGLVLWQTWRRSDSKYMFPSIPDLAKGSRGPVMLPHGMTV